ncbi:MAG: M48 family metallopeptidase [bacterium]
MPKINKLIRSKRRTISLEIDAAANLIVRAPKRIPLAEVERLVRQKEAWIVKKQTEMRQRVETFIVIDETGRENAYQVIKQRLDLYAERFGLKYKKFSLSNARRRWGSCTSKGSIRINWRLINAPVEVLDYVIIHELMHLREPNHSSRFWRLVEERVANYRLHRKWLKSTSLPLTQK